MAETSPGPARRAAIALLAAGVLLAGGVGVAWWTDAEERLGLSFGPVDAPLRTPPENSVEGPSAVPAPAGLDLPAVPQAGVAARALPRRGVGVSSEAVRRAVRRAVTGPAGTRRLGPRVALAVAGTDGRPVLRTGPSAVVPASTLKLLTTAAALHALGPDHRFATRSVLSGRTLVLLGGGDPLLASRPGLGSYPPGADLVSLARLTARALQDAGRARVRLSFDDTLFTGPRASPAWKPDYLTDNEVSPVSALWVEEGRDRPGLADRVDDPARDAARTFATELRRRGVEVLGAPRRGRAPEGAPVLATVRGAPLVEVVQHVLETSDNDGAEALAHHVGLATERPGSFAGGAAGVRQVLTGLGVPMRGAVLLDGSGLARGDRLRPETLLRVLALAFDPASPEFAGVAQGLPVAGFSGSLALRFAVGGEEGLGFVRAKTGTLSGVHGLAGVVAGRDGSVMTFAVLADRVREAQALDARAQLDRVASALAACACAVGSRS